MNLNDALQQFRSDPSLLEKISQSEDGQALMTRLRQNGQALEQASQVGQQGDLLAMTNLLRGVMADSEGRALLERLAKQLK